MARDLFGRTIATQDQVQAARDLGYSDQEIDDFFRQTNRIREDQTLGARASAFGGKATDILIPQNKKYWTQVATAPETLPTEQLKRQMSQEAQAQGISNNWEKLGFVLKNAPRIWGTGLKEQLPPGAEAAAYLSPQLKAAKGAGLGAKVGTAALSGGMAGTIGAIPAAMEAEEGVDKAGALLGGATTGAVIGGTMAAVGHAAGKGLEKARKFKASQAVKSQVKKALKGSNLGKETIAKYADDVARGNLGIDEVLQEAFPISDTSRFMTTPGDEMIMGQFKIGSKYAQNQVRLPETIQYAKRWNLLDSDMARMGMRGQQYGEMVDDVVNRAVMSPGGTATKVDDAFTAAAEAQKRSIGLSERDLQAINLRLQDILSSTGGYDDQIGYVSRDKALDMYRAARNQAYIHGQKSAKKGLGSVYGGISDQAEESMAEIYRAFADDIAANLEKSMPDGAVEKAFANTGYHQLMQQQSPQMADDLMKAAQKGLLRFNSQASPLWKLRNAAAMTLDAAGSPVYNMAQGATSQLGRLTQGGLNPLSILRPLAESPAVNITAGQAMNRAGQLGTGWATSGIGQATNKLLQGLGSGAARRIAVPPAAAGVARFMGE